MYTNVLDQLPLLELHISLFSCLLLLWSLADWMAAQPCLCAEQREIWLTFSHVHSLASVPYSSPSPCSSCYTSSFYSVQHHTIWSKQLATPYPSSLCHLNSTKRPHFLKSTKEDLFWLLSWQDDPTTASSCLIVTSSLFIILIWENEVHFIRCWTCVTPQAVVVKDPSGSRYAWLSKSLRAIQ